ncbi:MAG: XRE family transcriptional regulator [Cardiobacteriaceae bacterium]|nr:XRE family transcriptional regulator [Cardiobacteriaceae bacterium]
MIDAEIRHITPADGNIFLDLGFPPDEAAKLKANSDMLIKTKLALANSDMLIKTKLALANSVSEWIDENHLKQEQAAEILGISRPRVSDVVNKKIGKFTIDALMSMLVKAGKTVQIQIL